MTDQLPQPLKIVRRASDRLTQAEQQRDSLIREAFEPWCRRQYGYTVDDIAEAAGLSRPRVYQIVNEAKGEQS